MNQSLVSLALVVVIGIVLFVYLIGFSAGQDDGHERGRATGKKEGSVRAFAVGYDRGKRERESQDDEEEPGSKPEGPRLAVLVLLALGTVVLLTLIGVIRPQG
jgi:hypothetical protein